MLRKTLDGYGIDVMTQATIDNRMRRGRTSLYFYFGVFAVSMLLISLHFESVWELRILGDIDVTLADLSTLILTILWITRQVRSQYASISYYGVIFACFSLAWMGFQAMRSPEAVRGVTLFLITLRDFIILLVIGTSLRRGIETQLLNKAVFFLGFGISVVVLVLYIPSLLFGYDSTVASALYEVDRGRFLRLEGFAQDPNYFALWLSISLFCCMYYGSIVGVL